jgi:hypothetical protein
MNEERRKADRRVSPAIGEFAVQERDQLRAEVGRLRGGLSEAKYRIEQGRVWAGTEYKLTGLHPIGQQKALDAIDAALAGSKEPTHD